MMWLDLRDAEQQTWLLNMDLVLAVLIEKGFQDPAAVMKLTFKCGQGNGEIVWRGATTEAVDILQRISRG